MRAWLRQLGALARKELLAAVRDRRSRFVIVGPPLIQLLVFGYAATFDLEHIPFAVYSEDRGAAGRALVARFAGSPHFALEAVLDREADIARVIDARDVLAVLRLPPRFSEDLEAGRDSRLQLIVDGRNSNTAMILLGYVRAIVVEFDRQWAASHGRAPPPVRLEPRAWYNPNLRSQWFIVPGIVALLTLVVTLVVTALSVAREREQGTFDQLLVTPLTPVQLLIGKLLPGAIIGLTEATLIIVVAVAWFRVPLAGSLSALYLGLGLFVLSVVGVGLMISSLAVTQQQALLGAFLFLVPSVILSGFATPIENMPHLVQLITFLSPLRYALVVVRGVFLQGAGFELLVDQYWPMALIALVSMSVATWLFRHRVA